MENIKNFEELGVSTRTIMAYGNVTVDLDEVYKRLPITKVDVPLTKKKKKPNIKKIKAPYGSIISLRKGNNFRGVITNPEAIEKKRLKEKYENGENFTVEDVERIKYYGTKSIKKKKKHEFTESDYYQFGLNIILKKNYFVNEITCILSIGNKNLNVMIFNSKMKIAGCKDVNQAMDAVLILWEHFKVFHSAKNPEYIFEIVMTNVDFKLGFPIDRKKLNTLLNDKSFDKVVSMSNYETTSNTNVNVKLYCKKPKNFKYDCLIIKDNLAIVKQVDKILYKTKKKKKDPSYTTFLIFQSSKIIISGRYYENMKNGYNFFINLILKNKNDIEEKIKNV